MPLGLGVSGFFQLPAAGRSGREVRLLVQPAETVSHPEVPARGGLRARALGQRLRVFLFPGSSGVYFHDAKLVQQPQIN